MSIQLSVESRNAQLDAWEATTGASAVLKIRTGAQPASCAAADSGTVLVSIQLPADYMAAASGGSKAMTGTWPETAAVAAGSAAHFRIYKSDGTTCTMQGSVTASGGGGDMTLDTVAITLSKVVVVTGFTMSAGNS